MRTTFFATALVAFIAQPTDAVTFDHVEALGSHGLAQVGAETELALVDYNDIRNDLDLS